MTVKITTTYYFRILPSSEVQRWVSGDGPPPAEDPNAQPACSQACCGHTTWRATDAALVGELRYRPEDGPCRCLKIQGTRVDCDGPETFGPPTDCTLGDIWDGKPMGIRFSWTIGLDWDSGLTSSVDNNGFVEIFDRSGCRVARSNAPAREREAELLAEARLYLY